MAPVGTLWGLPVQRQTEVILAAAAVAGLEIETPPMEFRVINRTPEYLSKFPARNVPAFEDRRGFKLFEGAAIAHYVSSLAPESGLLGKNLREAALVDQWMHFGDTEICMFSYEINALVHGYLGPYSKEANARHQSQRQACFLRCLDEHLATSASGYLMSDSLTLADIAIAAVSEQAAKIACGTAERAQYPNVFAHYERVTAHPKVKAVFGEPEFEEEGLKYKAETLSE